MSPEQRSSQSLKPEAIARLVEGHREFLSFLERRVESREAAEDILQAAFVRGLERGAGVDDEKVVAWFYRVLRNAVIDHYRTRKVTAALEDVKLSDPGHAETVENGIDSAVEMQSIKAALQTLTDDQRQVLLLKFIDEMSNEEIARYLGKREGAIRALQMRGLKALSKRLAEKIPI